MRALPLLLAVAIGSVGHAAAPAVREWPVANFAAIELNGVGDLVVTTGRSFSVRATGDPELLARLTATVNPHGVLVLDYRHGAIQGSHGPVHIAVSMPKLAGLESTGTGSIDADRLEGGRAMLATSGTGSIRVATIAAGTATVRVGGTGSVTVAGRADRLEADASGTGSIRAAALVARGATLSASGTGSIAATVNGPAAVSLSGIGSITVGGAPACTVHKSGIGRVHCG